MKCLDTTPEYAKGFIDGTVHARKADGLDWAKTKMAGLEALERAREVVAEREQEIRKLKLELREAEERNLDLESQLRAMHIAFRQLEREAAQDDRKRRV